MPIYEYRCENGHLFEVMQKMTDAPVTACEVCGAPVTRVYHPPSVHFKGSGFYRTDSRGKPAKAWLEGETLRVAALDQQLRAGSIDYIKAHPTSVVKTAWWTSRRTPRAEACRRAARSTTSRSALRTGRRSDAAARSLWRRG